MARWLTTRLDPTGTARRALASAVLLAADRRGVTAMEYGLIAAGIAAVIVVAVFTMGDIVGAMFTNTADAVDQAIGS
jgi:pilus assembly protein Flp/PilA